MAVHVGGQEIIAAEILGANIGAPITQEKLREWCKECTELGGSWKTTADLLHGDGYNNAAAWRNADEARLVTLGVPSYCSHRYLAALKLKMISKT